MYQMSIGHWTAVFLALALILFCTFVLFRMLLIGKRESQAMNPKLSKDIVTATLAAIIKLHPEYSKEEINALKDIFGEIPYLFNRHEDDRKIAFTNICNRIQSYRIMGNKFSDVHSHINAVLLKNDLYQYAKQFNELIRQ